MNLAEISFKILNSVKALFSPTVKYYFSCVQPLSFTLTNFFQVDHSKLHRVFFYTFSFPLNFNNFPYP